jgi:hypothetical protein
MEADEAMTRRALDLLGTARNDAYEAALTALREDTQAWWADVLARHPDELEENEAARHRRRRRPMPLSRNRGSAVVRDQEKGTVNSPVTRPPTCTDERPLSGVKRT